MTSSKPVKPIDYRDGRSRSIYVAIHYDGTFHLCGVISFNGTTGVSGFSYFSDYEGPPLDPINLNYRKAGFRSFGVNRRTNQDMLHRCFVDYLPGPWGLQILLAEYPELKTLKAAERLHWFGTRTVGSLSFFVKHIEDERPIHGIDLLEDIRKRSMDFVMSRIQTFGGGRWEMESLASHGGARPKCVFVDSNGGQWLVKFNVETDAYNFARVEHAIATLASKCHINAVETKSAAITPDQDMLFIRRFDKTPDGRPHKMSAFSMMREDIVRAQNEGDYKMLFDLLGTICCNPEKSREELYRRMLFNIAINNTDDHLKNFEILLDRNRNCYELSPAYDMTVDPYPNPRQTSVFGLSRPSLDNTTIEHILKQLPLDRDKAYRIRDQIAANVAEWKPLMAEHNVSPRDLERLSKAFEYGLRDLEDKRPTAAVKPPRPHT